VITRRWFIGVVALFATHCSSPPPPPAVLTLTVIGGKDQNPDPDDPQKSPASVAVRWFQLNNTAKFELSDFFPLTEKEQETLGQDSQGSHEVIIEPGQTKTITQELKKGVQFVGIAVAFHDIEKAHWRLVSPVADSGPSKLTLKINGTNATLS
jgi:type VI secretion system protein VasD